MIHRFVRRANICAILAVVSVTPYFMRWHAYQDIIYQASMGAFMFFFWLAMAFYVKAKGHNPAWLLMPAVFGGLGLYGMRRLKDRHKQDGTRPLKPVKFPAKR